MNEKEIVEEFMKQETFSFAIVKTIGQAKHLLTEGDEVFETEDEKEAARIVNVLNQNTDNGCIYELISIPKRI
jgi:hypothetical protein